MHERFIAWLNNFPEFKEGTNIRAIFNDAIRCFKCDIPRPALMLSYIAFLQAVKENILNASRPMKVKESYWCKIRKDLSNNEQWEKSTFESILYQGNTNKNERPIFDISQSLRDDVAYWRNRRNDCAHYRENEISLSHVCAFWQFLISSYTEFMPLGSISQCITEYETHYDISLIPEDADDTVIFNHLCQVIKTKEDVLDFIKETKERHAMKIYQLLDLLHRMLLKNETIGNAVIDAAHFDDSLFLLLIKNNISDLPILIGNDAKRIRKLWYDATKTISGATVYEELLKDKLIPQKEIKESMEKFLSLYYNNGNSIFIANVNKDILLNEGKLYDVFISEFFTKDRLCSNPGPNCYKTDFFISVIRLGGITDAFVRNLQKALTSTFPYTLRSCLKKLLTEEKYEEVYLDKIRQLGLADNLHVIA